MGSTLLQDVKGTFSMTSRPVPMDNINKKCVGKEMDANLVEQCDT